MSLNTCSIVSHVRLSMMIILVDSWGDGVGRSVTISADLLSDGDCELMCFISVSTSSRNRGSTSMTL